jgi:Cu(I)/Ag(I) efflux system protein CusF
MNHILLAAAAAIFASYRLDKLTQSAHFKFEGITAMQKNTFVVSLMSVAVLSASGLMLLAQSADAATFKPIFMADAGMDMKGMDMKNKQLEAATHHGTGTVKKIDAGMVTLSHGPIATLNWPAMTMGFKLKDAALARGIKVGDVVDFELVQSDNRYVVTRLSGK